MYLSLIWVYSRFLGIFLEDFTKGYLEFLHKNQTI